MTPDEAQAALYAMERSIMEYIQLRIDLQWHDFVRRAGGRQGRISSSKEGDTYLLIHVYSTRPWLLGLFPTWRSGKIEVSYISNRRTVFSLDVEKYDSGGSWSWSAIDINILLEVVDLLERGQLS